MLEELECLRIGPHLAYASAGPASRAQNLEP